MKDGAVNNLIKELGWRKIIIHIAKNWNKYITGLVALITAAIGYYSGQWNALWGIAIPSLLIIIDKLVTSGAVGKKIMKFVLPKIEGSYRKHIIKLLRDSEKPYEETIVKETLEKNPVLSECRKIME